MTYERKVVKFDQTPVSERPRTIDVSSFSPAAKLRASLEKLENAPEITFTQKLPKRYYSDAEVARVKALLTIMTIPAVTLLTGVPQLIVRDWKSGRQKSHVMPDREFLQRIKAITLEAHNRQDENAAHRRSPVLSAGLSASRH